MPDMQSPSSPSLSWSPLLEALPLGLVMTDAQGHYIQANAAALQILGMSRESLYSRHLLQPRMNLMATDGSVLSPEDTPWAVALRTGKAMPRQVLGVVMDDGDALWLEVSAQPLAEGGVLVTFENVTRHHLAEAILAARARLSDLSDSVSLPDLLRATLDEAERLTGSCVGFYHFMEEDQSTLSLQAWSTRADQEFCRAESKGTQYPVEPAGVWVDAVRARKPVIHNDCASLPHKKGLPEGHAEISRELVVPVLRGDRIVALLGVGNKPFPYGARDLQTVMGLADLSWDLTERKRVESALRASEARYRSQFEHMTQGAFRQAADGSLIDVNPAALKLFGITREAFLNRDSLSPAWDVIDDRGAPLPGERHPSMVALRTGQMVTGQTAGILNPTSGERVWVEISAVPECRENESLPDQVLVTLHDVTARRQAEAASLEEQKRTEAIFNTTLECLFLTDASTHRLVEVNPAFTTLTGYSREEALGHTTQELNLWWDDAERVAYLASLQLKGKAEVVLARIRTREGKLIWGQANTLPLHLDSGPFLLHTVRNVTAQVEAERALKESEARWQILVEQAGDAVELLDEEGRYLQVNEATCQTLGYSREELLGMTVMEVDPHLTPELYRTQFSSLLDRPPETFEAFHRRKDGRLFPVEITASTFRLNGQTRTLAHVRDITERKRAEVALRESEARFRTMFEDSPIGIWEEDFSSVYVAIQALRLDGVEDFRSYLDEHPEEVGRLAGLVRVLAINRASVQTLKASSESELVRNLPSYFTAESLQAFKEELVALAESKTKYTVEGQHLDAHGNPLMFEISYSVVAGQEAPFSRVLVSFVDITERKAIESALRESELRMREALTFNERLLATMPIGAAVYQSDSGRCILANEAMIQATGATREAMLAKCFREIPSWKSSGLLDVAERVLLTDLGGHIDFQVTTSFGRSCWLSFDLSTFSTLEGKNLLLLCVDMTERKEAERAVARSEAQYRGLFDSMGEGFALHEILTDKEGRPIDYRFLDVNPAFVSMTGIPKESWIGRTVLEVLPGLEARWIREFGQVALTGRSVTFEDEAKILGRWYRVTAYQPAPRQFATLVTDITERRQRDAERHQLDQQMARAQKMDSLGSLAGGVAHDMNNVLGAIMGLASLHQEQAPEDSRLHKSMGTILKACTRGRTLVKGLLGFARPGLEEVRVLDLNEFIREEVTLLERTIPANVVIEQDLAERLPPVLGDAASLSHLLMNLCVNALDAMPEGGTLRLRSVPVASDSVAIEIGDTGCGMTEEVLDKALDPFFTTKPQGKGTGLGLSIAYGVVKAHRGRLELSSTPGAGTRVLLTFPTTTGLCAIEPADAPFRPSGRPLRILVVDDDELIQDSVGELLRSLGHHPFAASSGEAALRLLNEGLSVDAVVLDLNMPGLGGAGTLPLLRASHSDLPVILATGKPDQVAMDLTAGTTRTLLLPKPFTGREIAGVLQQLELGE